MCGIAGLIGTEKYNETDIKQMINKIAYRGPDEQGSINLGNIFFGVNFLKNLFILTYKHITFASYGFEKRGI